MSHPLIFNVSCSVLGWGPGLTVFWWEPRCAGFMVDKSWRHICVQLGRLEIGVQWL